MEKLIGCTDPVFTNLLYYLSFFDTLFEVPIELVLKINDQVSSLLNEKYDISLLEIIENFNC